MCEEFSVLWWGCLRVKGSLLRVKFVVASYESYVRLLDGVACRVNFDSEGCGGVAELPLRA